VDGVFVDYPIAEKAERIIKTAETLAARDAATGGFTTRPLRPRGSPST